MVRYFRETFWEEQLSRKPLYQGKDSSPQFREAGMDLKVAGRTYGCWKQD